MTAEKHNPFSDLLVQRMNAYDPPVRPRDLVEWLGVTSAVAWNWINRGSVPRDAATLHRLAQGFGDPPELWFRAAGRPLWPAVARGPHGEALTGEERMLENIEAVRRNPFWSPEDKVIIIAAMEQRMHGRSSRRELIASEYDVEGVSSTFVAVPKEQDPADASEQPTRKLDALPRRLSPPSQTSNTSKSDEPPTRPRAPRPPGTQHERRAAGTGTAAPRAHRATSAASRGKEL